MGKPSNKAQEASFAVSPTPLRTVSNSSHDACTKAARRAPLASYRPSALPLAQHFMMRCSAVLYTPERCIRVAAQVSPTGRCDAELYP